MGFSAGSLFLKITFILLIVALVIQILGLALPYWYEVSIDSINYDLDAGLFRMCIETGNHKTCSSIKNPADWIAATQAFEIIGLLLIIAALVLCIVVLFVKNDMKILKLICWILCFCAFAFIIIGCIIFGAKFGDLYDEGLSGAFAITIIAGVICLVCGVLALLDWKK